MGGQRAKAHAGNRDGNGQLDRLLGEARAQHRRGVALLAIAFQRVTRCRAGQEYQIVKVRHLAFGTETTDLIQPGGGGMVNVVDDAAVKAPALFLLETPVLPGLLWILSLLVHAFSRGACQRYQRSAPPNRRGHCRAQH